MCQQKGKGTDLFFLLPWSPLSSKFNPPLNPFMNLFDKFRANLLVALAELLVVSSPIHHKDYLAIVTPLDNMMRIVRQYHPCCI